jgi:hypothetical protein
MSTQVAVQVAVVDPVDPFGGGQFGLVDGPPPPLRPDQLGFVQAVDRFGQRVVARIADAADGSGDVGIRKTLRGPDQVESALEALIGVDHRPGCGRLAELAVDR